MDRDRTLTTSTRAATVALSPDRAWDVVASGVDGPQWYVDAAPFVFRGALDRLVDLLPATFRVDWAARIHRSDGITRATGAAPAELPFVEIERPTRLDGPDGLGTTDDPDTLYAGARIDGNEVVVVARRGGPEFLDSEVARLGHLAGLASSISRQ